MVDSGAIGAALGTVRPALEAQHASTANRCRGVGLSIGRVFMMMVLGWHRAARGNGCLSFANWRDSVFCTLSDKVLVTWGIGPGPRRR